MAGRRHTLLLVMLSAALPAGTVLADPPGPEEAKLDAERLRPGIYPAAPVPQDFALPDEPGHPPFQLDWSIGLKGSYTSSTDGNSFLTTLNPQFTALHEGGRTDLVIEGSGEFARAAEGDPAATALRLGLSSTTALDRDTILTGNAALDWTQDLPDMPGLDPNITTPPQQLAGALGLGVERRFGRFNLGLGGDVERNLYGPTTRRDTGLTSNEDQNVWEGDVALRLGLQATPILEVFGEASIGRDWFDRPSAAGVKSDATGYAIRTGLAGEWNGIWSASASIGLGQHDFDTAGLADITTRLYDASLTYSPDPTVNITAGLSTSIEPTGADANGTARVLHTLTADADYLINSWLRLRASADWSQSLLEGSGETERRHGLGVGADYTLNRSAAVSADYGYAHRDNSESGKLDSHTISVGVTLRR